MFLSQTIHRFLRSFGFDYYRVTTGADEAARLAQLFKTYQVDLILDVGANKGQYGRRMRELGYSGRIVSFEPLASAYKVLQPRARADGNWQTFPYALGAAEATTTLHIAGNSESSSLLDMLPAHVELASESRLVGEQSIAVKTLDGIFDAVRQSARNVFLKIDTQGYELQVLNGAEHSLGEIPTVQVEMSLVPLYEGAPLYRECLDYLETRGYRLVSLEAALVHPTTGELVQVDGIFHKYG